MDAARRLMAAQPPPPGSDSDEDDYVGPVSDDDDGEPAAANLVRNVFLRTVRQFSPPGGAVGPMRAPPLNAIQQGFAHLLGVGVPSTPGTSASSADLAARMRKAQEARRRRAAPWQVVTAESPAADDDAVRVSAAYAGWCATPSPPLAEGDVVRVKAGFGECQHETAPAEAIVVRTFSAGALPATHAATCRADDVLLAWRPCDRPTSLRIGSCDSRRLERAPATGGAADVRVLQALATVYRDDEGAAPLAPGDLVTLKVDVCGAPPPAMPQTFAFSSWLPAPGALVDGEFVDCTVLALMLPDNHAVLLDMDSRTLKRVAR